MKPHDRRMHPARAAALAAAALLFVAVPRAGADVLPPDAHQLADVTSSNNVAMAPYMSQSGWDIRHIIFTYSASADTLLVDVKTTGIAGDADGLGIPGQYDPQLSAYGGYNPANLGGRDSISIAFMSANANRTIGSPVAIAGVPEYKPANAPQDGFRVTQYTGSPILQVAYGSAMTGIGGALLNGGPSAQHPDFEFTITNFSKILGLSMANGFYISAYAGSPDDVVAGEDSIPWTYVSGLRPFEQVINPQFPVNPIAPGAAPIESLAPHPQVVPEPSSIALVAVGAIGIGVASTRRRRAFAA